MFIIVFSDNFSIVKISRNYTSSIISSGICYVEKIYKICHQKVKVCNVGITNSGIGVRKCSYFCMKTSVLLYGKVRTLVRKGPYSCTEKFVLLYKNVRTPRAVNGSIHLQHFEVLYELYGL